ncbi:hypothetical protein FPRO06_11925 [Fusarium proliferatum]|nr:hypothetical protein FPRO06_11925 [Fusarium proliferatum]
MESVWFKLKHTHYTAPDVATLGTEGRETGPILLGHFIPDLNHLDQVINQGCIKAFPDDMEVWPSKTIEFQWEDSQSNQAGVSGSMTVPTDTTAGIGGNTSAQVAFQQSVENFAKFKSLDCYIVNPVNHYINDCIKQSALADHIKTEKRFGTWKVYMITGIMIARGAKTSHKEESHADANAEAGVSAAEVACASAGGHISQNQSQSSSGSSSTDFVWAIRLARIFKNLEHFLLSKDWSMITETEGATFAPEDNSVDVAQVVAREGMKDFDQVIEDQEHGLTFVL